MTIARVQTTRKPCGTGTARPTSGNQAARDLPVHNRHAHVDDQAVRVPSLQDLDEALPRMLNRVHLSEVIFTSITRDLKLRAEPVIEKGALGVQSPGSLVFSRATGLSPSTFISGAATIYRRYLVIRSAPVAGSGIARLPDGLDDPGEVPLKVQRPLVQIAGR